MFFLWCGCRYQQELERQLEEQEQKKQEAYEEFLKEKLMIDEIVRKIYEEDQRWVKEKRLSMGWCKTAVTPVSLAMELLQSYTKPSILKLENIFGGLKSHSTCALERHECWLLLDLYSQLEWNSYLY